MSNLEIFIVILGFSSYITLPVLAWRNYKNLGDYLMRNDIMYVLYVLYMVVAFCAPFGLIVNWIITK